MSDRTSLIEQIVRSKEEIMKLKDATPYLFYEYDDMNTKKAKLKKAAEEYKEALARWEGLGK